VTLSDTIRAARAAAGLTQQQAADRCGVGQVTWARWETGVRAPTVATLERIAAALGCALQVLLVPPRR